MGRKLVANEKNILTKNSESCLFAKIITLLSALDFISPAIAMFRKIFAAVKIEESRKTWEQLSRKVAVLIEQNVVETRVEERLRLEQLIEQTEKERRELEKKLLHLEQQRDGANSLPISEDSPPTDKFSPDWPSAPWWVSALANLKPRHLLLLLILGAGAIIFSSQFRQTSSPPKQVHPGRNDSISLASEKAADKSEVTMEAQSPAVESSQEKSTGSGKGTSIIITTSGQSPMTISGDIINAGGNAEKNNAK